MQQPPKRKYRKCMKGRNRGMCTGRRVVHGDFALQATGRGRLTPRQIEAARRAIARRIKRGGKVWIRVFCDKPITKKPLEVRQGKGKGNVEYYVYQTKPGAILFEIAGITEDLAREALLLASTKLPFKCQFISKEGGV